MAISINTSFHVGAALPIDDRAYLTKAEMLAIDENIYPDYFLAVCKDDGKIYLYNKSSTTPSAETGKFTVVESGLDTAIQFETLPPATENVGKIYQYIGETTTDLTKAYWYISAVGTTKVNYYGWNNGVRDYFTKTTNLAAVDAVYSKTDTGDVEKENDDEWSIDPDTGVFTIHGDVATRKEEVDFVKTVPDTEEKWHEIEVQHTPVYTVEATDETTEGYLKTYVLKKDGEEVAGSKIDIPKDLVVTAGKVTKIKKIGDGVIETTSVGSVFKEKVVELGGTLADGTATCTPILEACGKTASDYEMYESQNVIVTSDSVNYTNIAIEKATGLIAVLGTGADDSHFGVTVTIASRGDERYIVDSDSTKTYVAADVEDEDSDYYGFPLESGTFIQLTIANQKAPVFVNVKDMVDTDAGTITEDIIANVEVGGVMVGDKIAQSTNITELAKQMFIKYYEPAIGLTSTPVNTVVKKGTTINVSLTAKAVKKSLDITSVKFLKGADLLEEVTTGVAGGGTFTHDVADEVTTDTTFSASVSDGKKTVTATAIKYEFVDPFYYGVSDTVPVTSLTGFTEVVEKSGKKTLTFTANNQYIVFAMPAAYPALTSILDGNGFQNLSSFDVDTTSVADYRIYTSKTTVTCSGFKYIFS